MAHSYLTDTHISGDSALIQSVFKTAYRHVCFGMAHCQTFSNLFGEFEVKLNQLLVLSHYRVDAV